MNRVDVLRAARAHQAAVGLHKGAWFADPDRPDTCACCPYGAIRWAMGANVVDVVETTRVIGLLKRAAPTRYVGPLADRASTTLADVLSWFDRAIARFDIHLIERRLP